MAIRPEVAFERSPETKLTNEEKGLVSALCEKVDRDLAEHWQGWIWKFKTPDLFIKQVAAIIRRYGEAGWTVMVQPFDGKLDKAPEILERGGAVEWLLTFIPRWEKNNVLRSVP